MSLNEIKDALAELPDKQRGSLAAWLLDSLPPHGSEDASGEGIAEAARRRDELDSGHVQPVSADEFWAAVERERSLWR
jgi:hypothetical protein